MEASTAQEARGAWWVQSWQRSVKLIRRIGKKITFQGGITTATASCLKTRSQTRLIRISRLRNPKTTPWASKECTSQVHTGTRFNFYKRKKNRTIVGKTTFKSIRYKKSLTPLYKKRMSTTLSRKPSRLRKRPRCRRMCSISTKMSILNWVKKI